MDISTASDFRAYINAHGGESQVIAITFDNTASQSFAGDHPKFTFDEYLNDECDCLDMPGMDILGNVYIVSKQLSNIQAIHFAADGHKPEEYDPKTSVG
jgi:hypothetical protein